MVTVIISLMFNIVVTMNFYSKLHTMEISGVLWSWFNYYLTNRVHIVALVSCYPGDLLYHSLGPILFLVSFFLLLLKVILFMFSDDYQCFSQIKYLILITLYCNKSQFTRK